MVTVALHRGSGSWDPEVQRHVENPPEKASYTVFIIDDNTMFLYLLGFYLKRDPRFQIYCYTSGEEAMRNMKLNPDIIILDYYLNAADPDAMNGMAMLLEIKRQRPEAIVIMLSAQHDLGVSIELLRSGAFTYLQKDKSALSTVRKTLEAICGDMSGFEESS